MFSATVGLDNRRWIILRLYNGPIACVKRGKYLVINILLWTSQAISPYHKTFCKYRINLPMKLPTLRQSVCKHRIILQMILPHLSRNGVIGLWVHFLIQVVILHIKNDASVFEWEWWPANIYGAVQRCTLSATLIGWRGIVTSGLLSISAGSTAIVINHGCASRQTKFCVLRMDISQDQTGWQGR